MSCLEDWGERLVYTTGAAVDEVDVCVTVKSSDRTPSCSSTSLPGLGVASRHVSMRFLATTHTKVVQFTRLSCYFDTNYTCN